MSIMMVYKSTKILVVLWMVAVTLAEPPVGDGYSALRSLDDHNHHQNHHEDHQRTPSQEYGVPNSEAARDALSSGYDYTPPNGRSSSNAGGRSRFPPATVRVSFNQRFGSDAKNSNQGYKYPASGSETPALGRRISEEYAAPDARSSSEEHGSFDVSARTLSTEYGMPDARSSPSQEYGAPVVAARSQAHSQSSFRNAGNNFADNHSTSAKSQFQTDLLDSINAPSGRIGAKPFSKSAISSRTIPSSTYGAPSSRSATSTRNSDQLKHNSISQTYGAPSQRDLSEDNESFGASAPSQESGVPSSRANLMTSAVVSAHPSARSPPSSSYLPASRSALSEQYGVPEQRDGAGQGYDYAKARALEELQNQEPASYDFGYQIEDQESGSDFGHSETREDGSAQGSYFVVLPDGTKQTVDYEADERGFKPRISVEPAERANGPY